MRREASRGREGVVGDVGTEFGRDVSGLEAEDFSPLVVVAEVAGRRFELALFEMGEKRSDEPRVGLRRSVHCVIDENDLFSDAAGGKANFVHSLVSTDVAAIRSG